MGGWWHCFTHMNIFKQSIDCHSGFHLWSGGCRGLPAQAKPAPWPPLPYAIDCDLAALGWWSFIFFVFADGNVISTYINHPRNVLMIQAITKILEKRLNPKPVNIAIRSFQMLVIVGLCLCVDCASSMTWERCGCKVCQICVCFKKSKHAFFGVQPW